ncbi:hypothetical protein bcgnr5369_15010 [Bacillus cereus]
MQRSNTHSYREKAFVESNSITSIKIKERANCELFLTPYFTSEIIDITKMSINTTIDQSCFEKYSPYNGFIMEFAKNAGI